MATKRKHHRRRKTATAPAPGRAHTKKHHRRKRRMGASGISGKAHKLLANPLVGTIAGALAGQILKNVVGGMFKDEKKKQMATFAPIVVGVLLRKKMPAVAGGMIAGPVLAEISKLKHADGKPMIPFLNDNGNINFTEDSLLEDNLLLSLPAGMPLSGQEYSLNDHRSGFDSYEMMED